MRVLDIMTEGVHTVRPATTMADAQERMRRKGIHHLVVMENAEIAGIVSARDARVAGAAAARTPVADVMTRNVVTVHPEDTVRRVANVMRGRTIGSVPVVEGKRVVGIVTIADLLAVLGRGIDRPARPARRNIAHRVAHRKRNRADGSW